MSSTHLDEVCEWVHDKRRLCCDEAEFRVTMLTDPCIDSSYFKNSMDAITSMSRWKFHFSVHFIQDIITGSQDYHEELRLLVTTNMAHNSSNDKH